ncbi:thioredoxin family protein [Spirulina sp. CCNP1310]|uniref:thioredoxin family protein n=1 Tax=Spirulina sp. CCNP1310 TaxID=3110249 RepID=UPI002B2182D2|nr:thioredoxin family protein [Spirulina sp. CCNP1310]
MPEESNVSLIGAYAPDFELPGVDGEVYHLTRYREQFRALVVIFMGNECPTVAQYIDRLKAMQTDFKEEGVSLIGINANAAQEGLKDSFEQMKRFAQAMELNFPYLRDPSQDVARGFGATMTPEVYLINQAGVICYHGAIDDQPQAADAVSQPYLRRSIQALLAGEAINPTDTAPQGTALTWRKTPVG